jgi:muramidase (phage lysozyme)
MATNNPLHKYRTYAYHFILLVSKNTTELANVDSSENAEILDRYMYPEGDITQKYSLKKIKDVEYVVVYNSMQGAEFSIDSVEMMHNSYTMDNSVRTTGALMNSLSMRIVEPLTVEFMTALYTAYSNVTGKALDGNIDLNLADIKLGLKVIFVGQLDDENSSKPHIITNVNLYEFIIKSVDMQVTSKGAVYDLECTPLPNGVAFHPDVSNIGGSSFKASYKMGDALRDLFVAINDRSKKSKETNPEQEFFEYKLLIDEKYEEPKYVLDNVSDAQKDTYDHAPQTKANGNDKASEAPSNNTDDVNKKNVENVGKNIMFSVKMDDTITKVITDITSLSKEVEKDKHVNFDDPKNPVSYMPKIVSDHSVPGQLVYHLKRDPINHATEIPQPSVPSTNDNKLNFPLEYDYIYTGKNIDVIKFDIRLKGYLMASSKYVVNHPQNIKNNEDLNNSNKNLTDPNKTDYSKNAVGNEQGQQNTTYNNSPSSHVAPIFSDNQRFGSGSLNPASVFGMRKAISGTPSILPNEMTLEIIGNPALLAGFIIPPDTYGKNGETNDVKTVDENLNKHEEDTGHPSSGMVMVKVNVRVPKPSYLQGSVIEEGYDNFYSTPFFFNDGYYMLMQIVSRFSHGTFKQIMTLKPRPNNSTLDAKDTNAKEKPSDNKAKADCVGCDTDNLKAFRDAIAHFEGTENEYNRLTNGQHGEKRYFDGYNDHPLRDWKSGTSKYKPYFYPKGNANYGKSSTGAGRYQFELSTWDDMKGKAGVSDFSPDSQDKGANEILKFYKVYDLIVAGKPVEAAAKLKSQWAYCKQPSDEIIKWFKKYGGKLADEMLNKDNADANKDCGCPATETAAGESDCTPDGFLKIALAEVGTVEDGGNNSNKYGKAMGMNNVPWCGLFVMYCAKKAGLTIPNVTKTSAGAAEFKKQKKWHTENPKPGDLVFFDWDGHGIDHVGIVVSSDGKNVKTVEGNTSSSGSGSQRNGDGVYSKSRSSKIVGYGRIDFCSGEKAPATNTATAGNPNLAKILQSAGYTPGTGEYELALAIGSKEGWNATANGGKGTRSYRNNNPGNLDYSDGFKSIDPSVTREDGNGRFAKFSTAEAGAKALVEHKIKRWANGNMPVTAGNQQQLPGGWKKGTPPTIKQFFYTYAPPSENNTKNYISGVVGALNAKGKNVNENTLVKDII